MGFKKTKKKNTAIYSMNPGTRPCKWGRKCHRADCYFFHPEGREIDEQFGYFPQQYQQYPPQMGQMYGMEHQNYVSEYQMQEEYSYIMAQEEEMAKKEEWYPAARNCECCKGYIYGCSDQTCLSLGICGCSYK